MQSTIFPRFAALCVLALALAFPPFAIGAEEFYFEGSPDRVLPDGIPGDVQRQASKGPVAPYQGTPAEYSYYWRFKDKKGIARTVRLQYVVYEPLSTRYSCGNDTKSNTACAFLNVVASTRMRRCPDSNAAYKKWDLRDGNIERRLIDTCGGNVSALIGKSPAPPSSYADVTLHDYRDNKEWFDQEFHGHYGNVVVNVSISVSDGTKDAAAIGHAAIAKLSGKSVAKSFVQEEAASESAAAAATDSNGPRFEVYALPSALGGPETRHAFLPASKKLPAKLFAKAKAGTPVTFVIRSGNGAILQAGSSTGREVVVKADKDGLAQALFYYTGGNINAPLEYEVRVTKSGERDTLTVHVGLGLAFDKIKAVKGDMLDTYPFTLTVKSRFHPELKLGNYLKIASDSGIWGGYGVGVALATTWVNAPGGVQSDQAFRGTTYISSTSEGENVLVVAKNDAPDAPQYFLTNFMYPAVVMKSDGRHAYKIDAEVVLLDARGEKLGVLEESMSQNDALAIVARDSPEHWMTSLVCSLEATSSEQYVMLETAKLLPVGGTAVEYLTSATGLMCKFGKAEYESLFYDIGTILGGKYLDHLNEPEVLAKLTQKQQTAAQLAKKAFDDLDTHKQNQEREKWLTSPLGRPPAPQETASTPRRPQSAPPEQAAGQATDPGKTLEGNLKDLGKSLNDLKGAFKGLLGK